jgi:hypothetical protein
MRKFVMRFVECTAYPSQDEDKIALEMTFDDGMVAAAADRERLTGRVAI